MPARGYRDLRVWQRSMDLLLDAYRISERLPAREVYVLDSQLRRAALSVPANIAEGAARFHRGDFVRHLSIARGSLAELETLIDAAGRLGYLPAEDRERLAAATASLGRMLTTLIRRLRAG